MRMTLVAKLAIVSHFVLLWLETIGKVANLGKLANVSPRPEMKILKFDKKCAALVGKDWTSCKSGKISHSESI